MPGTEVTSKKKPVLGYGDYGFRQGNSICSPVLLKQILKGQSPKSEFLVNKAGPRTSFRSNINMYFAK